MSRDAVGHGHDNGRRWQMVTSPDRYTEPLAENTTPGTTDMTVAYQAALDFSAGKFLDGLPGQIYGITSELTMKSGTFWDWNGSTMKALAVASPTFFSLWRPENGRRNFRVTNGNIDGNSQTGMIGFILKAGSHDGKVDNFFIENMVHDKGGVNGGRGFNIESLATALDNPNLIVSNTTVRDSLHGLFSAKRRWRSHTSQCHRD